MDLFWFQAWSLHYKCRNILSLMALWLQGDRPNFPCATYWRDWRVLTFFSLFFALSLSHALPNLRGCSPSRHSFVSPWCAISRPVWFQLNWHLGWMLATWRERRTLSACLWWYLYTRSSLAVEAIAMTTGQEAGSRQCSIGMESRDNACITRRFLFPFHSIVIIAPLFPQAAYCRLFTGFWTCVCRHMFDTWVYACRHSSHSQQSRSLCSWPLCGSSMSGVVGILGAGGWLS